MNRTWAMVNHARMHTEGTWMCQPVSLTRDVSVLDDVVGYARRSCPSPRIWTGFTGFLANLRKSQTRAAQAGFCWLDYPLGVPESSLYISHRIAPQDRLRRAQNG